MADSKLAPTACSDGTLKFSFKLPDKNLALDSVCIEAGVPVLYFRASKNVPTLTEEDVAVVFRLVMEGKRPEFFYLSFPPTHSLHHSLFYKHYSPAWTRGTSVGELLSESDWSMKCLSHGTRTDESKSVFKAWSRSSNMKGVQSCWSHPDPDNRVKSAPMIMSCKQVKVQKGDSKLVFPEEPKLKIESETNKSWSQHISEQLPNIGHHDEPRFLKLQELLKLIVAVEWLYKEKNVRVCQEWVETHTPGQAEKPNAGNEPPPKMIPHLPAFKEPSSDVSSSKGTVQLRESLEYRFGFHDVEQSAVVAFKEDGTPCPPLKYQLWDMEFRSEVSPFSLKLPVLCVPKESESGREVTFSLPPPPLPATPDVTVTTSRDEDGMEMRITQAIQAFQPWHPLIPLEFKETVIVRARNAKPHASEDPNEGIEVDIRGKREVVFPNVKSWKELISDHTVPIPYAWLTHPSEGVGKPVAIGWGGVSTSSFNVQSEPLPQKPPHRVTQRSGNFSKCGHLLGVHGQVQADEQMVSVKEEVVSDDIPRRDRKSPALPRREKRMQDQGKFESLGPHHFDVSQKFLKSWKKKSSLPKIIQIFGISNLHLEARWEAFKRKHPQPVEQYFHGTYLACDILSTSPHAPCNIGDCGICGISCSGLNRECIETRATRRLGKRFYLAPNSSKSNEYCESAEGLRYRAMLLCDVLPGRKYVYTSSEILQDWPEGYDSVYAQSGDTSPEIAVHEANSGAIIPRYVIVYRQ